MTPDDKHDGKPSSTGGDAAEGGDERLLEALRHELAKQELLDYQPSREELREAEPIARQWQQRVNERRRELRRIESERAVELPRTEGLLDKPREWLLARLVELRELARALPGGLQIAYRNVDAHSLDELPTEELRTLVADLEAAIAVASSPR